MICNSNYVLDLGGKFNVVVLKYKSINPVFFFLPTIKKAKKKKKSNEKYVILEEMNTF